MSTVTSLTTAGRLQRLRDVALTVAVGARVDSLVETTLRAALDVMGGSSASMSRYERDRARVKILHNVGDLAEWEQEWPPDRYYPIADYAQLMTTLGGQHTTWTGSLDDPLTSAADRELLQRLGKRYAAAFQIRVADRVWGDLYVTRAAGEPFTPDDCAAGSALAGLLSAGLSRLDTLDDLARLAYTDPLTGLANRRAADDWLLQRLAAPEPFPPVSAVLCDINGLKQVNDDFGHAAGDELVRAAANTLTGAIGDARDVLVARIGGDEFVVLLDGAEVTEVDALVQRVAAVMLPHHSGLAVGAATTRTRAAGTQSAKTAARALLRLADAAQYRHKQTRQLSGDTLLVGAAPVPALIPPEAATITDRVLAGFRTGGRTVEHRLQVVCDAFAEVYDASTWWVSRQRHGILVDVLSRMLRNDVRGALAGIEMMSGVEFNPADYPATRHALSGGSYTASLTEGDPVEQALLARMGYVSVLGAGETGADGTGWLVELYGDPQTSPGLFSAEPCLRALVHLAVTGATR